MNSPQVAKSLLVIVSLVWLGLVMGVSFIATPAKFLAPTLELPVALDVGRHTFGVFAIVEAVAAIALSGLALAFRRHLAVAIPAGVVVLVVVLEQVWLLPVLDARVETIIQGGMPEPSALHSVYVLLEGLKVVLLIGLAWIALSMTHLRGRE